MGNNHYEEKSSYFRVFDKIPDLHSSNGYQGMRCGGRQVVVLMDKVLHKIIGTFRRITRPSSKTLRFGANPNFARFLSKGIVEIREIRENRAILSGGVTFFVARRRFNSQCASMFARAPSNEAQRYHILLRNAQD